MEYSPLEISDKRRNVIKVGYVQNIPKNPIDNISELSRGFFGAVAVPSGKSISIDSMKREVPIIIRPATGDFGDELNQFIADHRSLVARFGEQLKREHRISVPIPFTAVAQMVLDEILLRFAVSVKGSQFQFVYRDEEGNTQETPVLEARECTLLGRDPGLDLVMGNDLIDLDRLIEVRVLTPHSGQRM